MKLCMVAHYLFLFFCWHIFTFHFPSFPFGLKVESWLAIRSNCKAFIKVLIKKKKKKKKKLLVEFLLITLSYSLSFKMDMESYGDEKK